MGEFHAIKADKTIETDASLAAAIYPLIRVRNGVAATETQQSTQPCNRRDALDDRVSVSLAVLETDRHNETVGEQCSLKRDVRAADAASLVVFSASHYIRPRPDPADPPAARSL